MPVKEQKFEFNAEGELKTTADILKRLPEPKRNEHWVKGALMRGFYSAAQGFHAANLSLTMLAPEWTNKYGLDALTGGEDALLQKIADLEKKIESHDIEPVDSKYWKSGASFLLFNTTYLIPVMAVGYGAMFLTGPFTAGLIAAVAIAHSQMGESVVNTARKHADGESIGHKEVLDEAMEDDKFRRIAQTNALVTGMIFVGITMATGNLARLLGGFTSGALTSLSRTPIGGLLTDRMVNLAHDSAVNSIRKPLAQIFTKAANDGPPYIAAKTAATLAFAKATTSAVMNKYIYSNEERAADQPNPVEEQDNDPQAPEAGQDFSDSADDIQTPPERNNEDEPKNQANGGGGPRPMGLG